MSGLSVCPKTAYESNLTPDPDYLCIQPVGVSSVSVYPVVGQVTVTKLLCFVISYFIK